MTCSLTSTASPAATSSRSFSKTYPQEHISLFYLRLRHWRVVTTRQIGHDARLRLRWGSQRNIVPLMLEGLDFGTPKIATQLTRTLPALQHHNGVRLPP